MMFSGLAAIFRFFDKIRLFKKLYQHFKTPMSNKTKYKNSQLMLSVISASMRGVSRVSNIAVFTADVLVKALLGLPVDTNKDVIFTRFKALGERGTRLSEELNTASIQSCALDRPV